MANREKVIKGLTGCITAGLEKACPADCPYFLQCFPDVGPATPFVLVMQDALALLKYQEAVKPTWSQGKACCGNCGQRLPRKRMDKEIKYCGCCGQAVRWDGSSSEIPNS